MGMVTARGVNYTHRRVLVSIRGTTPPVKNSAPPPYAMQPSQTDNVTWIPDFVSVSSMRTGTGSQAPQEDNATPATPTTMEKTASLSANVTVTGCVIVVQVCACALHRLLTASGVTSSATHVWTVTLVSSARASMSRFPRSVPMVLR